MPREKKDQAKNKVKILKILSDGHSKSYVSSNTGMYPMLVFRLVKEMINEGFLKKIENSYPLMYAVTKPGLSFIFENDRGVCPKDMASKPVINVDIPPDEFSADKIFLNCKVLFKPKENYFTTQKKTRTAWIRIMEWNDCTVIEYEGIRKDNKQGRITLRFEFKVKVRGINPDDIEFLIKARGRDLRNTFQDQFGYALSELMYGKKRLSEVDFKREVLGEFETESTPMGLYNKLEGEYNGKDFGADSSKYPTGDIRLKTLERLKKYATTGENVEYLKERIKIMEEMVDLLSNTVMNQTDKIDNLLEGQTLIMKKIINEDKKEEAPNVKSIDNDDCMFN